MRKWFAGVLAVLLGVSACGEAYAQTCQTACSTTNGANRVEQAANGLAAGQCCRIVPTLQAGGSMDDYFYTCGSGAISAWSYSMAWDWTNNRLWFVGTPHGGPEGMAGYDATTNTLVALDAADDPDGGGPLTYVGGLNSGGSTCSLSSPWANPSNSFSSNAEHAYDSVNSFDGRYFYYNHFRSEVVSRFDTQGPSWSNLSNIGGGINSAHTGAIAYWPETNSLILLATAGSSEGGCGNVYRYAIGTGTWSHIGATGMDAQYHCQVEYHPAGNGEVLVTGGNGSNTYFRVTWDGASTFTLSSPQTGNTGGVGFGISAGYRCSADPASTTAKYICVQLDYEFYPGNGSIPIGNWRVFDPVANTITALNVTGGMPPILNWTAEGDGLATTVEEYGVLAYVSFASSWPGIYIYKHTAAGGGQQQGGECVGQGGGIVHPGEECPDN